MFEPSYKKVISFGDSIFPELELKSFILNLPLNDQNISSQEGIQEKIYRNFSYKSQEESIELGVFKNKDDVFDLRFNNLGCLDEMLMSILPRDENLNEDDYLTIENATNILCDPTLNGIIFVTAKQTQMEQPRKTPNFRPILGAVIEILNDKERAIRVMFCKRRLSYNITEKLIRLSVGRILIHAIKWDSDNTDISEDKPNGKFISIMDSHIQFFPIPAYNMLIKELKMTAHWESPYEKVTHVDNPKTKCKCHKFSDFADSTKFWGISESRYISIIKSNPEIFGSQVQLSDFIGCSTLDPTGSLIERIESSNTSSSISLYEDESSSPSDHKKRKVNELPTDMQNYER